MSLKKTVFLTMTCHLEQHNTCPSQLEHFQGVHTGHDAHRPAGLNIYTGQHELRSRLA